MRRMRLVCIFVLFMIENAEMVPLAELLLVKICSFYQEARFKPHTMIQIIQTKGNSRGIPSTDMKKLRVGKLYEEKSTHLAHMVGSGFLHDPRPPFSS